MSAEYLLFFLFLLLFLSLFLSLTEMRKFYGQGSQVQPQYGAHANQFNPTASFIQHSNFLSKTELGRCVLAELPDQLVLWMRKLKPVV